MCRKRGKWTGWGLIYLTSVNICVRKLLHMLCNRLCQHFLRLTVRMRNMSYASPRLWCCSCFCLCFSFRHAVLWFFYIYTFVVAFVQFGFSFIFSVDFPTPLLCSSDCSFDYISINWWQFYVCTFQHLSAFEMFIFYDALGRFFLLPHSGSAMKICKHFMLFPSTRLR